MRRLLIGFAGLVLTGITIVLVVPFFLPKDEIKRQVVAQVDERFGWRLRLEGPVSLSLFPGFSLVAEKIGVAGEAGADGIEFARADRMQVDLAWGGLLSGNIQVTGLSLDTPKIVLDIGPDGTTSWEPRRTLGAAEADGTPAAERASPSSSAAIGEAPEAGEKGTTRAYLKRLGVDRLEIINGSVSYRDHASGQNVSIENLGLVLAVPDLSGAADLSSQFSYSGHSYSVTGRLTDPLSFAAGEEMPVAITVKSGEASISAEGTAGVSPVRVNLAMKAASPSLAELGGLTGTSLPDNPGAFELEARVEGSEAALSVADLHVALGALSIGGALDADMRGLVPEFSGRIVLKDGSIGDLLALVGRQLPASGTLGADLAFATAGLTTDELIAGLDVKGAVTVANGEIGGLGLSSAAGGDTEADRIRDLSVKVDVRGLSEPVDLTGALSWRGEGFSISGNADTAKLLAGSSSPVSVTVKGNRLSAGFDGSARMNGSLDGAVRVETADLRGLMAWLGQPIGVGGGLKGFKASGIFAVRDNGVAFEETRFSLDETSGEANGRIDFGAKPRVTATLSLRELVLDPYLGAGGAGGKSGAASAGGSNGSGRQAAAAGAWSTDPIDFSGLAAVDAAFKISAQSIRWDKINIGESALSADIRDGVLRANLEKLALYNGSGSGSVVLNGAAAVPAVSAQLDLSGLDAYPVLRDAASFDWLEGKAAVQVAVQASGASEQALVGSLKGEAGYQFADGAIRGINIPQMVRGLSVETLLGWQENSAEKTDFSSLSASFVIDNGIATTTDLSLIGPLVRMSGKGTTDMPNRTLAWRVEPKIVPTLEGQAPQPRAKGEDKKLAGLGVPIVIDGSWDNPRIYPDIAGILKDPEAAYKQLQQAGGELISILEGQKKAPDVLVEQANKVIEQATGGRTQIDVQKVIEGQVNDEEILKAVEEGFGLPPGMLGIFGGKKKDSN